MPSLRPTPAEIAIRLEALSYAEKLTEASSLIERMTPFAADAADAMAAALEPRVDVDRRHLRRWLDALPASPVASYLRAAAAASMRELEDAAAYWADFFSLAACDDPFVFLSAARTLARLDRWNGVGAHLRAALQLRPPYSFFTRAQKLLEQTAQATPPGSRHVRLAVLGSSTTSLMVPVIRALAFRDGIDIEAYEGLYGAFRQEMLDADSGLARFRPDILIVASQWRDLNLPPVSDNDEDVVDRIVGEYVALWKASSDRLGCHVIQHAFDLPAQESFGPLSARLPGGRTRITRSINMRLQAAAPSYVSILDTERIIAEVGLAAWEQPGLWQMARQHPATDALPALAEEQLAHIRAVTGLTRKVLVCDLDNTLWGGVIGEDGLEGIQIGGASAEGQCFSELQRYIRELKERGVLLAVCSKNNVEDARAPFERNPDMQLRLDDFAAFVANWDDKATNIRRIAATLNLGLDSIVLLDDNPLERAWIRRELPQVAVVELGKAPSTYVRALDRERHFVSLAWSLEDRVRTDRYRSGAAADTAKSQAVSVEAFLESLHMHGTCVPVSPDNIARVVQLINKTNQFNLTTRRYTQPQVEHIVAAPGSWSGVFSLADCYGDHGIVGLLFAVPDEDSTRQKAWRIDTWLMSCRVLGRQFEQYMMDRLVKAAREHGIARIRGVFRPTAKNSLVADLLPRLGFEPAGAAGDGERSFVLDVESVSGAYTRYVEDRSAEASRYESALPKP